MIALSEPWGTTLLLIGLVAFNTFFLWRLKRMRARHSREFQETLDQMDRRLAKTMPVGIEDARASERRAIAERSSWFESHEPTRMAVIAASTCDDAHRAHVIAQWQVALARHDAIAQVESAKAKRVRRKKEGS